MKRFGLEIPRQQVYRIVLQTEPVQGEICGFSQELQASCAFDGGVLTISAETIPALPHLFEGFSFLQEIVGVEKMKPQGSSLSHLFSGCTMLRQLNLSSWNLSAVKDFSAMFRDCLLLEDVKIHVSGGENLSSMFENCPSLKQVDVSHWDLSEARELSSMFAGCLSLEEADVSRWNVSKVRSFRRLFLECGKLEQLDVSGWRISAAEDCSAMFSCCKALKKLDVSRWSPKKLRNCSLMFNRCENLRQLGIGGWRCNREIKDCTKMFHQCRRLKKLDLRRFVWDNVTSDFMFIGCGAKILLKNSEEFSTLLPRNSWFRGFSGEGRLMFVSRICLCGREQLPKGGWPADVRNSGYLTAAVEQDTLRLCGPEKIFANPNSHYAFAIHSRDGHSYLRELEGLQRLDTSKVENFQEMFADNISLTHLDIAHFDTKNARSLAGMFRGCVQLRAVDVSGWNTANCESFLQMFDDCRWLRAVDVSRWNTEKCRDFRGMFHNCQLLQSPDLRGWSRSPQAYCYLMFEGCPRVSDEARAFAE